METFRTKSYTASFASDQSNHNEGFGTAPLCYQFRHIYMEDDDEWGSYNNGGYRYR